MLREIARRVKRKRVIQAWKIMVLTHLTSKRAKLRKMGQIHCLVTRCLKKKKNSKRMSKLKR
jgi:hypothetical protein